jgi:hypothetical protein
MTRFRVLPVYQCCVGRFRAREAFLRTALGAALAGRHDDADVIRLTQRAVKNPHPAMQPTYGGW